MSVTDRLSSHTAIEAKNQKQWATKSQNRPRLRAHQKSRSEELHSHRRFVRQDEKTKKIQTPRPRLTSLTTCSLDCQSIVIHLDTIQSTKAKIARTTI